MCSLNLYVLTTLLLIPPLKQVHEKVLNETEQVVPVVQPQAAHVYRSTTQLLGDQNFITNSARVLGVETIPADLNTRAAELQAIHDVAVEKLRLDKIKKLNA